MNTEELKCPLFLIESGKFNSTTYCIKEKCAWWISDIVGCCSIKMIAYELIRSNK